MSARCAAVLAVAALVGAPTALEASTPPRVSWTRVTTERHVVTSNGGVRPAAQLASELETMRAVLARIFSVVEGDPVPMSVIVDVAGDAWRADTDGGAHGGWWLSGPDGDVVAGNPTPAFVRDACVRAFIRSHLPPLPAWLEEGLVHFYRGMKVEGEVVSLGLEFGEHARTMLARDRVPLARALGVSEPVESGDAERELDFRMHATCFVHHLMTDPRRAPQAASFLVRLAAGEAPAEALTAAFGTSLDGMDAEFQAFVRSGRYSTVSFDLPGARVVVPPHGAEVARSEALVLLGDALLARGDATAAAEHFREALSLAPQSAGAHSGLGAALDARGQHDAAAPLHEKALALDAQSAIVHHRVGVHALRRARAVEPPPPGSWDQARSHLLRASQLAPSNAGHLHGVGLAHALHAYEDSAEGIRALERMRRLVPGRTEILVPLGAIYMRRGETDRAARVLEIAAASSSLDVAAAARALLAGAEPATIVARLPLHRAVQIHGASYGSWASWLHEASGRVGPHGSAITPRRERDFLPQSRHDTGRPPSPRGRP